MPNTPEFRKHGVPLSLGKRIAEEGVAAGGNLSAARAQQWVDECARQGVPGVTAANVQAVAKLGFDEQRNRTAMGSGSGHPSGIRRRASSKRKKRGLRVDSKTLRGIASVVAGLLMLALAFWVVTSN
jgi:hypothetical protein